MSDQPANLESSSNDFQQGIAPAEFGLARGQDAAAGDQIAPPSIPKMSQFVLPALDTAKATTQRHPMELLRDVELSVSLEVGRTRMELDEVRHLRSGTVVALDRRTSEPVDVVVNGQLLARGEVIVMDGKLCVRVNEIIGKEAA